MDSHQTDPNQVVLAYTYAAARGYFAVASITWLFYDHLSTLDVEVERIWSKAPHKGSKLLFLLHRYYNFLLYLVSVIIISNENVKSRLCRHFFAYTAVTQTISSFLVAAILALRTLALYQHSKLIFALLITTYLVSFVGQLYPLLDTSTHSDPDPLRLPQGVVDCGHHAVGPYSERLWGLAYWIGNTAYDTVVFVLTLYQTTRLGIKGVHTPLISRLKSHGLVYFGIILIFNAIMTVLFLALECSHLKSIFAPFTHIVTLVAISRLELHIKAELKDHTIVVGEDGKLEYLTRNSDGLDKQRKTKGKGRATIVWNRNPSESSGGNYARPIKKSPTPPATLAFDPPDTV